MLQMWRVSSQLQMWRVTWTAPSSNLNQGKALAHCFPSVFWVSLKTELLLSKMLPSWVKGWSDNSYFEGRNLVLLSQAIKDCLTPEIAGWGSCSNRALCGSWRRCSVVTAPPELCKNPSKEIPILASFPLSVSFPIPLYLFQLPVSFVLFFVQIIHLLII